MKKAKRNSKTNENDDDEPEFRVRYIRNGEKGYWEQYNCIKKTWFRLCDECNKKICRFSNDLCTYHYKNKPKLKKKSKRLNRKCHENKQIQISFSSKIEETIQLSPIILSVSSNVRKKQISQIKEFIEKFDNEHQKVQLTCDLQPDFIDDTTTHLITNDFGSFTTVLTKQIVQACARHIFIGSFDWILTSLKQSSIQDHFPYEILRDKNSSNNSRGIKQCRFDNLPVFPSSSIISVECHLGVKQMRMTRDELIEIVELSGATLFNSHMKCQRLIVLCNSKTEMIHKKKESIENLCLINENHVYFCKPEYLFDSIVKHEVQSVDKYLW